jgi:hypothetical protein
MFGIGWLDATFEVTGIIWWGCTIGLVLLVSLVRTK